MAKSSFKSLTARMRAIGKEALAEIKDAADAEALEALRVSILGKKSELKTLMRQMGQLTSEEKPEAGKVANEITQQLTEALGTRKEVFTQQQRLLRLTEENIDVTLPGRPAQRGHVHPLNQARQEIVDIFSQLGFEVASGPDLEDEFHNFEALNMPANHPARDMQDTFYLTGEGLLRTHTSPVQIRAMQSRQPPVAVIAPGRVYRCDADLTHSPMFNQIEGFMVDENIRMSDLKGVLELLIARYFGADRPFRMRPSYFPFTEPSAEIDILWRRADGREEWLEVLGAGMIHPVVLEKGGYDSKVLSGFAFGLGVERFVMLKYGVTNIRLFYENDLRFLRQF
jgi:phenylalanyl-tRNA synthetase alpha chain